MKISILACLLTLTVTLLVADGTQAYFPADGIPTGAGGAYFAPNCRGDASVAA